MLINFYSVLALCIAWYIFRTLSINENSDIFRHIHVLFRPIQPYGGIFKTLCSSWIFRTLPYSESWHKYIFRTLSKHILAYSLGCVTLAFWKNCFIQNFAIFRISALGNSRHIQNPVYLGTFRHVQTYSIMIIWTIFLHFFIFFFILFNGILKNIHARPSLFK